MKKLFILGNGFDLCLGMKTSYWDFFNSDDIKNFETLYCDSSIDSEDFKNTNLFLAYLFKMKLDKNSDWNHIEKNIINYVEFVVKEKSTISITSPNTKFQNLISKLDFMNDNKFIIDELKKFEKIFGEYIRHEEQYLLQDHKRFPLATDKINKIFNFNIKVSSEEVTIFSFIHIINFNYTNYISQAIKALTYKVETFPFNKSRYKIDLQQVNIHGNTDNPIFGIDSLDIEKYKDVYFKNVFIREERDYEQEYVLYSILQKLTKTARIMEDKTVHADWKLPSPRDLEEINFFGHSLSKADYSYFQSIFDYYNIYDSHIKLNFLYNKNYDKDGANQHTNVMNLMTNYGYTLDNKDKGKNLLHKMLLENRIHLTGLDV
ncbi:MAG: bacteriophage abortive infection AbiH family protein [Fusobacteriales bacterium]|jgi:hypothetical protein|nr:bacteriophage abortive infection AbiH family protein [Fusobacteriales bacterium]